MIDEIIRRWNTEQVDYDHIANKYGEYCSIRYWSEYYKCIVEN